MIVLKGKSASPGVAVGRIHIHNNYYKIPKESVISQDEVQSHLDKYNSVKEKAREELDSIIKKLNGGAKADIFTAHKEIVDDVIINEEIPSKIKYDKWAGDWAIYHVYETALSVLKKTPDPLIAERSSDFEDVRSLLLKLWHGQKSEGLETIKEPVIIAALELMPQDAANMNKDKIKAVLTETGGLTSHAAIIAKSLGIPTVLGVNGLMDNAGQGQTAAVDANSGIVIIEPEKKEEEEYKKKAEKYLLDKKEEQTYLEKECFTKCGQRIDIGINIANACADLDAEKYADSVGVFRTEFLYMGRNALPSEDEQYEAYRKVLERFGGRPVIIRTLDIGGDKQLSSLNMPREENPFLGVRALRFCFTNPDIFKTQIRALLRAAAFGNLWIMLPMAGSMDDIQKAKEFISQACDELKKSGAPLGAYKLGIMIEIPSIALIADVAAKETDFASIGSNDLCQYLCAADRMNANTEEYYQSYHPAMFKLLKEAVAAYNSAGKPISICGETGSDPKAVPLLIGLGLRKLSVNISAIAAVKRAISQVTVKQCKELAEKVLKCATQNEAQNILTAELAELLGGKK